jgi:hypothetical protein
MKTVFRFPMRDPAGLHGDALRIRDLCVLKHMARSKQKESEMRNLDQVERTNPFASIPNKTMKTSHALTLLGTLLLAASTTTTARAGTGYNSKHGSAPEPRYVAAVDLGHFTWLAPDASVNHIVVSLADQSLYAYNGKQLVAYSNISSGKPGHETPTGSFTVSEKDPDHHSSLYENASMPFFMRLTDGGVGLHAGFIPGYPASHGCVRLPLGMARELFQHVESGTPVEIVPTSVNTSVTDSAPVASTVHLAQN